MYTVEVHLYAQQFRAFPHNAFRYLILPIETCVWRHHFSLNCQRVNIVASYNMAMCTAFSLPSFKFVKRYIFIVWNILCINWKLQTSRVFLWKLHFVMLHFPKIWMRYRDVLCRVLLTLLSFQWKSWASSISLHGTSVTCTKQHDYHLSQAWMATSTIHVLKCKLCTYMTRMSTYPIKVIERPNIGI